MDDMMAPQQPGIDLSKLKPETMMKIIALVMQDMGGEGAAPAVPPQFTAAGPGLPPAMPMGGPHAVR